MRPNKAGSEVMGELRDQDWHSRAVCPKCDWHERAPFGSIFHVHRDCCPRCGAPKRSFREALFYGDTSTEWRVKIMRWVPTSNFWKPSTWFSGYWENVDEVVDREAQKSEGD